MRLPSAIRPLSRGVITVVAGVLLAALWFFLSLAGIPDTTNLAPWSAVGTEYMVAADHPLASQAGARILAQGGNAADAAVAVSFALGVVRPYSTGLGGGGFLMIKNPDEKPIVVDFRERAPQACTPEKYLDESGQPVPSRTVHGEWAVGVPGTLKGMAYVLDRFGAMSLAEVIQPALELAENGFPVDEHTHGVINDLADFMRNRPERQAKYRDLYETFLRDGQPYEVGDTLKRSSLAATLRLIATHGPDVLYAEDGILHRALVGYMEKNNGPLTSRDLADYKITIREPIAGQFMGYETWTMPPPSSGGAVITEVLNSVEIFGLPEDDKPSWSHYLVESFKHAFADRAQGLGDWDFDQDGEIHRTVARMTDTATARMIVDDIDPDETHTSDHYGTGKLAEDHGTSHYCVIDPAGRAVACTETINFEFGSFVMIPGTGIVLNDQLDDFSIASGVANLYGLVQSDLNLIAPGKRPLSSMSPTIITRDGAPVMIAGGSGGPRIITGALHVILNTLYFGMRPDEAVAAPRFHHQWSPDIVRVEDELNCLSVQGFVTRGHRVSQYPSHPGIIQTIHITNGFLFGASDPRKGGKPAGHISPEILPRWECSA